MTGVLEEGAYIHADEGGEHYQHTAGAKDQAQQSESDPKYPASNFTPIVVFVNNQLVDQAQDEFDPKYPAAYFKPKVIYP